MALLLTTTGTQASVIFYDLGERTVTHPTTDLNLELEYPLWELLESSDLFSALSNGYITLTFDGAAVNTDTFKSLSRGNMQTFTYDVDLNGIVDTASTSGNSLKLNGSTGSFYLDRANHTGTQTSSSISDFTTAVSAVVMLSSGTSGYALFASTSGWATNAAHSYTSDNSTLLNGQNDAYYLNRTNHTGTQVAATISDFVSVTNGIIGAYGTSGWATNSAHAYTSDTATNATLLNSQNGAFYLNRTNHTGTQVAATISDFNSVTQGIIGQYGTMGWATNSANAYQLNNQPASFYLNTNSSINALVDVDTVTVAPTNTNLLNYSTAGTGNWVPIAAKSVITRNTWLLSAGVAGNATNRYCDWWGGTMNLSGYVVPTNATIQYISVATNASASWTAEVRQNGTNVAQLAITTATSGRSTILSVNVNAGDVITLFVTGSNVPRPTITVHFVER